MEIEELKNKLKQLIVEECDKEDEIEWQEIEDDAPLFGNDSKVGLDSLDALQLALIIKQNFGIRVESSKESRKDLYSINTIVALIEREKSKDLA
ncbi:acyl carrier protein [Pseudoalteromonas sp. P1-9]|uniref:phosphopantetheine-binding protein n=1 Tax=Pseudoalteromonas sp. P1-9 TaxID=1710354 RepID=UPI0006D5EA96|nr:phosphopantetheine-binding protein [Pseudoalteromonas sp. P1-9]KPV94985.1 acyl carrier protein [Pseudoalteromonas sp. P1-9]